MDDLPPDLVDLQRTAHAAWDAVEAHRREVDARRRAEADEQDAQARAAGERVPEVPSWGRRALRPWTGDEDAEHARLMDAARHAQEVLRQGVAGAELDGGYDVAQGLHRAARGE
jgi:hypothetical protein